ncbi:Ubiquinone biosynthesis O-methyltransferase [Candidatus Pandoraea novymonadis]|uniref:Ubiquinone biosynthesis O-methyltransferase n=2 Tax=Candidatus Pandoraea novymonadis TaxID=1808959 RepID=A0ABX5FE81_9BURK|nr:Ubiquinone biosynthesis O-methyltransferase [Candidatus Pandoraea novymonadis]
MNVDPKELQKFTEIAHRWWDPQSEFKPLHEINPLRLRWIEQHVALQGKRILDVGCGGGILTEAMARQGAQLKGIDLSSKALGVANLHSIESGLVIEYEEIAIEALAIREAGSYDIVTCLEMLEHVPSPLAIVTACATLVKPGGYLFFSTLNRNLKAYMLAVIGAEYVLRMIPIGTHDYAKFIRPSELASFARASSLKIEDLIGVTYNPFMKNYRLSSSTNVNYMMACTRDVLDTQTHC